MRLVSMLSIAALFSFSLFGASLAGAKPRGGSANKEGDKAMTVEEALDSAEHLLDNGGDASDIAARLHKSRGFSKDEQRRLDLIDARCALISGSFAASEKLLVRLHKGAPEDTRITELYARALDGDGKSDVAMPLLKDLADKDGLRDGDSYWTLAKLEREKGDAKTALVHARAALSHPIVFQSDELDKEIHKFIDELSKK